MKTKPEFRKVVFEYDCMCFFGGIYKLILLEDGWLIRVEYDFESLIINSPELAKSIKQLIKENKEELKRLLSKNVSNPGICDGVSETFRFGRMKIEGPNILAVSMEG